MWYYNDIESRCSCTIDRNELGSPTTLHEGELYIDDDATPSTARNSRSRTSSFEVAKPQGYTGLFPDNYGHIFVQSSTNPSSEDQDALQDSQHTNHVLHDENPRSIPLVSSDIESVKQGPPPPVGFWHPALKQTRSSVVKKYAATLSILCVTVVGILSIYWGVLFNVKAKLANVNVAVVSFEGQAPFTSTTPLVEPILRQVIDAEVRNNPQHLGFKFVPASRFDGDPINVRRAVFEEEYWAAVVINPNASALLQTAVRNGNSSYDPYGAGQIIFNQARDVESYNFYIIPELNRVAYEVTNSFSRQWLQSLIGEITFADATPAALSPAIAFTNYNLRPFDPPTAIPTISIGLIYLIIIAFFSFTFFIPTHMRFVLPNPSQPHPPLKFVQLIIYRYFATITAYFFLSLCYSLVSLAFQIPFSNSPPNALAEDGHWSPLLPIANANYLKHATFLVYWLLNFCGMAALGLACENMAMLLSALSPLPFSALFLIFWVITNVSTGFYALELASDFYRWGYVWPLRQIVEGSKTLVFGTRSRLGWNFGILLIWILVSTIIWPMACWVMRWKTIKDKQRAAMTAAAGPGMKQKTQKPAWTGERLVNLVRGPLATADE